MKAFIGTEPSRDGGDYLVLTIGDHNLNKYGRPVSLRVRRGDYPIAASDISDYREDHETMRDFLLQLIDKINRE